MDPLTMILIAIGLILAVIIAIILVRTFQYPVSTSEPEPIALTEIDGEEVAQHIGLAIQMKTINHVDSEKVDPVPFQGLHNLISMLYPEVEEYLEREVIGNYSLLYTWKGSDLNLDPIALTAHMDVVPAREDPDSGWEYPPFSGTVVDGYVWGRGAIDCKGVMIGILEAVNFLLKVGFQPRRTVYLAFGEDEEVSGARGAAQIAQTLKERGVHLSFLLDEGGAISQGSVPGVDTPVGLVGVAEKGHLSLVLRAETAAGHASAPGQVTSIGALALAIATLENNPFPQDLDFVEFMMSFLADELPFTQKMALANRWLFGKSVAKRFAASPASNANTRTTIAPTIINGGHTENVLPATAEAIINLRLMPGDTLVDVYKHVNELVGDDVVKVLPAHEESLYGDHSWDPTEVSDVDSPQFHILLDLIKATMPGATAAPYLMSGATDARHYMQICDRAFRFSPFVLTKEESETVHGINERLSFENAARMVGFLIELIERMSSIPTDFYGDEDEDEGEDEESERRIIRKVDEPLPTRPMRKPEVEEPEILPEEAEFLPDDEFEPLPEDDEPLQVKPLKEE